MKPNFFIIVLSCVCAVAVGGCRTSSESSSFAASGRHADSVAALRSIGAKCIERESEVTTIVMRIDTATGELRVVEKGIVKTVEKSAENAVRYDTARFFVQAKEETEQRTETAVERTGTSRGRGAGFIAGMWLCFATLGATMALILHAQWKSRN